MEPLIEIPINSGDVPSGLNLEQVSKANGELLKHELPHPVDALLFHTRAPGDHGGLFELVKDNYERGLIKYIVLPKNEGERFDGNDPRDANFGKTFYTAFLESLGGVNEDAILYSGDARHTKAESDAFLRLAKEQGLKSVAVLAQPHQILRAMLSLVASIKEQNYWIEAYPLVPESTDWELLVCGSQGLEAKPRKEHIRDELERIALYQAKGDLASFDELSDYLRKRDSNQLPE